MRAVSITAIRAYRNKALHDKNVPDDVLKIRLNCLVDAVNPENIHNKIGEKIYQFGSCLIEIENDIMKNIRWTENKEESLDEKIKKMVTLFIKNGLDKHGRKFIK